MAASESHQLFSTLHQYISNASEDDILDLHQVDGSGSRQQALRTYCDLVNVSVDVDLVLNDPNCVTVSVILHGVAVKSHCCGGSIPRKERRRMEEQLCGEVLRELVQLQRSCEENATYALLQIFTGFPAIHQLPAHQLSTVKCPKHTQQTRGHQIPSYVLEYCQQHISTAEVPGTLRTAG
mmetsp:Transcript_824/g.1847  ORF Transcript_824/g.1847 Transcript_824/m.1847 type:complete len:180 (-) Transcript_824:2921-3460(-)